MQPGASTNMRRTYNSPSPLGARANRQGMSLSPSKGSPTHGEGKISLRVDQPVEGCQVMTHAFFRSVEGEIDDKAVDMEFHWYRSSLRRACANSECPMNNSEAGGGNVLLLVAKIECVTCCRLGITRDHSSFCSVDCFRLAWTTHKLLHEKYAMLAAQNSPKQDDSDVSLPWKSQLHHMDQFCPRREDSWIEIHQEKCVPRAESIVFVVRDLLTVQDDCVSGPTRPRPATLVMSCEWNAGSFSATAARKHRSMSILGSFCHVLPLESWPTMFS